MQDPKIKTKVVHSQSKHAWNIVGTTLGGKYKIARVPYHVSTCQVLSEKYLEEAREHAEFISFCFNNSEQIIEGIDIT